MIRIDKLLDIFKHTHEKYRCTLQARKNEGDNFYHSFDCLYTGSYKIRNFISRRGKSISMNRKEKVLIYLNNVCIGKN